MKGCDRAFGIKTFAKLCEMWMKNYSIPDQSRRGSPTTASGVARQGTCGRYDTAELGENKKRKRGERRVKRQWELRKGRRTVIRMGTLNVGTMTGKERDLADLMERRKIDVLCLQEAKWKNNKARNIGGGCKLFYNGADGKDIG